MKKIIGFCLQILFGLFPIKKNKILFETCNGEVKDHLKAIYDYMKHQEIDDYDFKWVITKGNDISAIQGNEIVYRKTIGYFYHLLTSHYWMRTHSVSTIVKKREGQIYIQLWHGPGAIKKEGFDIEGVENTGETVFHAKEWDYFIATDEICQRYIQSATNIRIPRILLGSCRSDALINVNQDKYYTLRADMGVTLEEKLVLYAPTFRDKDLETSSVSLKIKELCKQEGIRVVLRLHPWVKERLNIKEYDSSVIDGNQYASIMDLYLASDILITDYSSVSIEYALLKKPILYYMYDLNDYEVERGFYYNYLDHLAGPIIKTEEELIRAVLEIDKVVGDYREKYEAYNHRYNRHNDGHVCERFCAMLMQGEFDEQQSKKNSMRG